MSVSPKKIQSPKKRTAEDTYFDREMCRFFWGDDYVQDDINSLGEIVSVHFVEGLDKLRRLINDTNGICIQALYQGLEAQKRNVRKNPALGKLVEVE